VANSSFRPCRNSAPGSSVIVVVVTPPAVDAAAARFTAYARAGTAVSASDRACARNTAASGIGAAAPNPAGVAAGPSKGAAEAQERALCGRISDDDFAEPDIDVEFVVRRGPSCSGARNLFPSEVGALYQGGGPLRRRVAQLNVDVETLV
jgi:hypothetical protein